jgi:hypothetical protein
VGSATSTRDPHPPHEDLAGIVAHQSTESSEREIVSLLVRASGARRWALSRCVLTHRSLRNLQATLLLKGLAMLCQGKVRVGHKIPGSRCLKALPFNEGLPGIFGCSRLQSGASFSSSA